MTWVMLALLVLPQQPAADKQVDALIERLASDDLESREKAQGDLYALGPSIKSRLEARLSEASGEVAKRIRGILDRFEGDKFFKELVPPEVRLTLERKRRTPEEIFTLIREKTGWNIRASAMNLREPVELGWTDAPALQVIDDVCRALGRGRVQLRGLTGDRHQMEYHGRSGRGAVEERIVSIDGSKPPSTWVAYSNHFRIELEDVTINETRDFASSKGNASIKLVLAGPPGMSNVQAGGWIIDELVDDKGRSLKSDAKPPRFAHEQPDLEPGESRDSVWFSSRDDYGMYMRPDLQMIVPAKDATRIALLKARIRVTFPGRPITETKKVEEMTEGSEFRVGEAVITILKAEKQGQQFSVRYRLGGRYQGRPLFEPLDAKGQPVPTQGGGSGGGGTDWHVNWYVRGEDVIQLRLKASVGHKTIEIPVEMKDVPLPKED